MNAAQTIVILGGGTGGIVAANLLRASLPSQHRVVLVDRTGSFFLGTTKTWVMAGLEKPDRASHPLDPLTKRGIEVMRAEVERIDVERRSVKTSQGEIRGDFLVIALGADMDFSVVPGLAECAQTFYTMDGAVKLHEALATFQGGEIAILVPRTPFKCPPGPYEGALLVHSFFEERGLSDEVHLSVWTIEKSPMATAGPEAGKFIEEQLASRGIDFHRQMTVEHAAGKRNAVTFDDGTVAPYDLLIGIPPHVAPRVVKESGLTQNGMWIPVDPMTLEVQGVKERHRVFAIGDVTSVALPGRFAPDMPLFLPKAGTFAEKHADTVCSIITAEITGKPSTAAYDGSGFCFIELGRKLAARGDGNFFETPKPKMSFREPDEAQVQEKRKWVKGWFEKFLDGAPKKST